MVLSKKFWLAQILTKSVIMSEVMVEQITFHDRSIFAIHLGFTKQVVKLRQVVVWDQWENMMRKMVIHVQWE